jgi:hypothetical protein
MNKREKEGGRRGRLTAEQRREKGKEERERKGEKGRNNGGSSPVVIIL